VAGGIAAAEYGLTALAAIICALTLVPFVAPGVKVWRLLLKLLAPGITPDDGVLRQVMRPPAGRLLFVVAVSVVGWLTTYAVVGLVCAAVGARVGFGYLLALAPFTSLARMVPISVGGLGLSELTMAALLIRAGVPDELAAQVSLISMALLALMPGAAGLVLVLLRRHQTTSATSQGNDVDTSAEEN
jgi:uncharacterized membrane protein YbhN (UPF0104 family)